MWQSHEGSVVVVGFFSLVGVFAFAGRHRAVGGGEGKGERSVFIHLSYRFALHPEQ